ncbi:MAG: pyridoxamine 5'-phosphate oxidase family protein [Candidatus Margulisiibacteriota bacterium]|nr:MAG: pyridoxamine 5'-phosphate oxidase [Candidatus Margulisbacteria bacterium GWD2_39_127]OGI02756.1 MAG: pyridoxamine 5'-phosphate oxidase [Candidatus Margulisbacteria bacterium GWF2_38_17]OGI09358.1 MAG: pyridoxamine 5'-phosphate oxidase [Candidatus Margulisbacteria bacterium GWE2_39_32]PZM84935.1 MAG: pyridoxamine 5'-phosphate oxidase family protein [Candidatus Margulisiibacteriota bacterium]HAR63659.1 pyridoxamine 5'-phosphate oxidase [Candidatus Margulisiibacteriota bacterium]
MNKAEVIDFINAHLGGHLATVEDGKPHVRGIFFYKADDDGIVFHTGTMKDLYRQVMANPNVETCFNDFQQGIQIRVSGVAQEIKDMDFKKEIVSKREFLQKMIESNAASYETLAVFYIKNCVATPWTMAANFATKEYIKF